ncbi:MAG: aminotransferase DegT [Candidatus Woesearchaeota archaeon]|nr:MAG: aminotransferase DegT [Candidatus Woesearchaeota archaeon]
MSRFIPISQPSITEKEINYVTDAVKSGWVSSLGKYIDRFESEFAAFCGVKHAVSTANGTVAIHLALVALGIKEGDEVIVPDFSFIATANAVRHTGAIPVFADIDPFNLCIDVASIRKKISPKTKAIIPVHIYGHPADMLAINTLAKEHNLIVIEDAAEAHGSSINGQKTGSWGICGTFSFYGNKNITSGEGGMITTNSDELNERLRFLRDHAMSKEKRYWHTEIGYNYRMTNLQAALGVAQLERADELIAKRKTIYSWYKKYLQNFDGATLNKTYSWAENTYWLICAELHNYNEEKRANFMYKMKQAGIDTRPFFYPMSKMPMYQKADNPITYTIFEKGINLPTYFDLNEEEVKYICEKIKELL